MKTENICPTCGMFRRNTGLRCECASRLDLDQLASDTLDFLGRIIRPEEIGRPTLCAADFTPRDPLTPAP